LLESVKQPKSTLDIQVKEIPNFDEEDENTERTDIEKYPTKKDEIGKNKNINKKPFDMVTEKIDEFEEDFEEDGKEKAKTNQQKKTNQKIQT
jgi:hypothetical protein